MARETATETGAHAIIGNAQTRLTREENMTTDAHEALKLAALQEILDILQKIRAELAAIRSAVQARK
jgi:hypothetical protein